MERRTDENHSIIHHSNASAPLLWCRPIESGISWEEWDSGENALQVIITRRDCTVYHTCNSWNKSSILHGRVPAHSPAFPTPLCFQCSPVCLSLSVSVCVVRGRALPLLTLPALGSWLPAHLPPISSSPPHFINPGSPPIRHQIVYSAAVVVTCLRPPCCSDPENYSSCLFPADYLLSSLLVPQGRFTSASLPAYLQSQRHFSQPSSPLHSTSIPPVPHNKPL